MAIVPTRYDSNVPDAVTAPDPAPAPTPIPAPAPAPVPTPVIEPPPSPSLGSSGFGKSYQSGEGPSLPASSDFGKAYSGQDEERSKSVV
jgi:hypothetical protein